MADLYLSSLTESEMVDRPLWVQAPLGDTAVEYSAVNDRQLTEATFGEEGPVFTGSFKLTQRAAGANYSVDVAPGFAVVRGDSVSNQGLYLIQLTSIKNVTVVNPPGSGTRYHRIIAEVRDTGVSGATQDWRLGVLEDTGSGLPALPSTALSLGYVAAASGAASYANAAIINHAPLVPRPGQVVGGSKYLGSGSAGGTYSNSAAVDTTLRTGSVSLRTGRRYRVEFGANMSISATNDVHLYLTHQLRNSAGALLDSQAQHLFTGVSNPTYRSQVAWEYEPASDEAQNFQLWGQCTKMTGTTLNWAQPKQGVSSYFLVRDLGPTAVLTAV
jgi:hypothetical protein